MSSFLWKLFSSPTNSGPNIDNESSSSDDDDEGGNKNNNDDGIARRLEQDEEDEDEDDDVFSTFGGEKSASDSQHDGDGGMGGILLDTQPMEIDNHVNPLGRDTALLLPDGRRTSSGNGERGNYGGGATAALKDGNDSNNAVVENDLQVKDSGIRMMDSANDTTTILPTTGSIASPSGIVGGGGGEHDGLEKDHQREEELMQQLQQQPEAMEKSSPLSQFFAHAAVTTGQSIINQHTTTITTAHAESNAVVSIKKWKDSRKKFLTDYFNRRLVGEDSDLNNDNAPPTKNGDDDDDDDDDNQDNDRFNQNNSDNNSNNDECCSFSSNVLDYPISQAAAPANNNNNIRIQKKQNDIADESSDNEDIEHYEPLETQQPEFATLNTTNANHQQQQQQSNHANNRTNASKFETVVDNENDNNNYPFLNSQEMMSSPPNNAPRDQDSGASVSSGSKSQEAQGTQEEAHATAQKGGIFGGIKRRLGLISSNKDEEEDSQPMMIDSQQPIAVDDGEIMPPANSNNDDDERNVAVVVNNGKHGKSKKRRGLMWDGNFEAVPHVKRTDHSCSKLNELDLSSHTTNLGLCRVLRIWEIRLTKRMEKNPRNHQGPVVGSSAISNLRGDLGTNNAMSDEEDFVISTPFEAFEDDGPLNTAYKKVFSIEIAQLEDNDDATHLHYPPSSPSVSNITKAAFRDGKDQLEKETLRKGRHSVRKIRVFFYNNYAETMNIAIQNLRSKSLEKKTNFVPFLMSFANVPAKCIMPLSIASDGCDPYLQQYVKNPFGDGDFGVLSPYCICIGDKSAIRLGCEKLYFDDDQIEIRLVEAPDGRPLSDISQQNFDLDDIVIDSTTIKSSVVKYEQSKLVKRYMGIMKLMKEPETLVLNSDDEQISSEDKALANDETTEINSPDGGVGGGNIAAAEVIKGNTGARAESGDADTGRETIHRPKSVVPLADLHPLLLRNNMKNLKEPITVYGVVLGFTPPSLTRMEDWKVSIALIDDTLPLSNQKQSARGSGDTMAANSEKTELHVPSVTVVLFSKDKSKLPVIRSAGDVICCRKVMLQQWNNEPQLCARKSSSIVAVRPRRERCPGDELQSLTHPDDWSVSCSCHDLNDEPHPAFDWPLANSLWLWGQQRLSSHPTMSPDCRITIAQVSEHVAGFEVSVSGDLTAVVTSIIPTPDHLRRRDTPRGYIRLWDGTGPPRTDPILGVQESEESRILAQGDPPEKVLLEIEKVLEDKSSTNLPNICEGIEAPIALCGRVLNAIIWEEHLWNLIQRESIIHVGTFVRLRNINNKSLINHNCLSVHAKSSLTPLPFDAYEVKMLLKEHDVQVKRGVPFNTTSSILPGKSSRPTEQGVPTANLLMPIVGATVQEYSTLDECIKKPASASFEIQFEISHTIPPCTATSANAMKALCFKNKDGSFGFRFAFHIKDSSAQIDVLCLGGVAEKILGITAQDVIDKPELCEGAFATLKLLMTPGSKRNGIIRSQLGKDRKLYFILKSMKI